MEVDFLTLTEVTRFLDLLSASGWAGVSALSGLEAGSGLGSERGALTTFLFWPTPLRFRMYLRFVLESGGLLLPEATDCPVPPSGISSSSCSVGTFLRWRGFSPSVIAPYLQCVDA